MKIPKEARKLSRSLFRSSFTNGRLDAAKVSAAVAETVSSKPRQYIAALKDLQRLVRLELARRHAVVESATPLDPGTTAQVETSLKARYGGDVTVEFQVQPGLIGGLRIKLGSDVWDGSVKGRLNRLEEQFSKA